MNDYELMYILHPRLTADEIDQAVDRISSQITDAGGEIVSVDRWGRRRLAYPIDRNLEGYYVLTTYKSQPAAGPLLEALLNLATDVLRHLLIRGIIPYEGIPRDERPADRGTREPVSAPSAEDAAETPADVTDSADNEGAAAPETVAEPEAAPETVAEPEAAPETVAEPEAAPETVAEPEAAPETVAESEAAPETVAEPEAAVPAEEAVEEEAQAAPPAAG
jgi:small subunit ribosomal protein S6